jgi:teichuronic acid biosynthesis glycosyltransferase TuaH
MDKHYDIIMLALPRWDGDYSSTAFSLAKEFSKQNRVFYIDNPFTFKDFVVGLRSKQIRSRKKALLLGKNVYTKIENTPGNLVAVTPKLTFPINFLPDGLLYRKISNLNDKIVFRTIKNLLFDYSIKDFIFINSFNPFYFQSFPSFFKPILYVYHTVDDISHSKYINKHGPKLENAAIRLADITFTTSRELKRLKSALSENIYYLPNAADAELFKKSITEKFAMPKELKTAKKPVVIYTGHIDLRLDYELLKHVLQIHSDKFFLMVGPISLSKELFDEIDLFDNVCFTGKKDIADLPGYLHYAHCAMIPFKCNVLTKSIYPLKVNEYLAAGKPVISTAFSEDIIDFKDVIEIAKDYQGFSSAITLAIDTDSSEKINARIQVAEGNTWHARVETFWGIAKKYLPH